MSSSTTRHLALPGLGPSRNTVLLAGEASSNVPRPNTPVKGQRNTEALQSRLFTPSPPPSPPPPITAGQFALYPPPVMATAVRINEEDLEEEIVSPPSSPFRCGTPSGLFEDEDPAKEALEQYYLSTNKYPNYSERLKLSKEIGVPSEAVRDWFATKRSRDATITNKEKQSHLANRTCSRKPRAKFTATQRQVLEDVFPDDPCPCRETRAALAAQLGVETESVDNWFRRKRAMLKKAAMSP